MSKCDSAVHYRWLDSFESFGGLHDSRCHCCQAEENEWAINLECFNPGESTCAIVGLRKTMEPKNFDWRLTGRHYSISSTPHQSDSICGQTAFLKQTPPPPLSLTPFQLHSLPRIFVSPQGGGEIRDTKPFNLSHNMSKFVAWQVVSLMKNEQQNQNLLLKV